MIVAEQEVMYVVVTLLANYDKGNVNYFKCDCHTTNILKSVPGFYPTCTSEQTLCD